MYKIDLGNGNVIECEKSGAYYIGEIEIGVLEGIKKTTIESEDGFVKVYKRGKVENVSEVNGKVKFMLRELTKDERVEEARQKKIKEQNKWIKEKYERVSLVMPIGTKSRIEGLGYKSVSSFINEAVKEKLERLEGV